MRFSYTALHVLIRYIYMLLVVIPNISNLSTFVGVETDYIPHYVDIVGFNSKKFINSGNSRI